MEENIKKNITKCVLPDLFALKKPELNMVAGFMEHVRMMIPAIPSIEIAASSKEKKLMVANVADILFNNVSVDIRLPRELDLVCSLFGSPIKLKPSNILSELKDPTEVLHLAVGFETILKNGDLILKLYKILKFLENYATFGASFSVMENSLLVGNPDEVLKFFVLSLFTDVVNDKDGIGESIINVSDSESGVFLEDDDEEADNVLDNIKLPCEGVISEAVASVAKVVGPISLGEGLTISDSGYVLCEGVQGLYYDYTHIGLGGKSKRFPIFGVISETTIALPAVDPVTLLPVDCKSILEKCYGVNSLMEKIIYQDKRIKCSKYEANVVLFDGQYHFYKSSVAKVIDVDRIINLHQLTLRAFVNWVSESKVATKVEFLTTFEDRLAQRMGVMRFPLLGYLNYFPWVNAGVRKLPYFPPSNFFSSCPFSQVEELEIYRKYGEVQCSEDEFKTSLSIFSQQLRKKTRVPLDTLLPYEKFDSAGKRLIESINKITPIVTSAQLVEKIYRVLGMDGQFSVPSDVKDDVSAACSILRVDHNVVSIHANAIGVELKCNGVFVKETYPNKVLTDRDLIESWTSKVRKLPLKLRVSPDDNSYQVVYSPELGSGRYVVLATVVASCFRSAITSFILHGYFFNVLEPGLKLLYWARCHAKEKSVVTVNHVEFVRQKKRVLVTNGNNYKKKKAPDIELTKPLETLKDVVESGYPD
jgi:hypothetical protein